jgi:hypothetical protein
MPAQIREICTLFGGDRQQPSYRTERRFTFTIESRCVIAAADRAWLVAACLRLGSLKDVRN